MQLMRARYAAYALGKVGYVIKTTHPNSPLYRTDTTAWRLDLKQFCDKTTFVSLDILETTETTVLFHAGLLQSGIDASFSENSLFENVNGRWLYLRTLDGGYGKQSS